MRTRAGERSIGPGILCAAFVLTLVAAGCRSDRFGLGADRRGSVAQLARIDGFDVEHYDLDLRLDPSTRSIEGTCRVRFVATRAGLERVVLDLSGLRVRDVRDDAGNTLAFAQRGERLAIELASALAQGDLGVVEVSYEGSPSSGLWFVGESSGAPGADLPTHAFTQGECEDASGWFPCRDLPSDRATHTLRARVPAGWTTVAGGSLTASTSSGGERIDEWETRFPLPPYLVTLVAGELVSVDDAFGDVPLQYLSPEPYAPLLENALADTDEALAFLEELTGRAYPFPKYAQACVENFPFGGMENASATTLTVQALGDERQLVDSPATGLVVHEAAHQWFGDLLTCETWPEIWLNEGFATYATLLFTERTRGRDEFLLALRAQQDQVVAADNGSARRPIVFDEYRDPMDLFFSGHVYQGGATRLHLLRHVLGDEAFFAGIRRYVALNENASVTTDDLRLALEEASGRRLETFFRQWVQSPGHPEVVVQWRFDPSARKVHLTVEQVQATGDGTPSVFEAPVDVEVRTPERTARHRIALTRRKQVFELPAESAPIWVLFDVEGALPKELDSRKSDGEWFAIAAEAANPNARRDAIDRLMAMAASPAAAPASAKLARAAVLERLERDEVPAVRARAAASIAALAPQFADVRAALVLAAREDPSLEVRRGALTALESCVAGGPGDELASAVEAGASWATMISAASLYRRAAPAAVAAARLREWMAIDSPHQVLRAALVPELAAVEGVTVADLAQFVGSREADRVRAAAVKELGVRAQGGGEAEALLGRCLAERSFRVRGAAIDALASFGSASALGALRAYYPSSVFPPERRAIEKALRP